MAPGPELDDYLAFFEAEPKLITPGTAWYYGVSFESVRGSDKIVAAVAPDEGEFSLKWWQEGQLRADLSFAGVTDWMIENKGKVEYLVLKFSDPKIQYFILRLKPRVSISWRVAWA